MRSTTLDLKQRHAYPWCMPVLRIRMKCSVQVCTLPPPRRKHNKHYQQPPLRLSTPSPLHSAPRPSQPDSMTSRRLDRRKGAGQRLNARQDDDVRGGDARRGLASVDRYKVRAISRSREGEIPRRVFEAISQGYFTSQNDLIALYFPGNGRSMPRIFLNGASRLF